MNTSASPALTHCCHPRRARERGSALITALIIVSFLAAGLVAVSRKTSFDLSFSVLSRLANNKAFVRDSGLTFLDDAHLFRSLVAGGDPNTLNCLSGLTDTCQSGVWGKVILRMPAPDNDNASVLGLSIDGSVCDARVETCAYKLEAQLRPLCASGSTCRAAMRGELQVTAKLKAKVNTGAIKLSTRPMADMTATFSYDDLMPPLVKAFVQHEALFGGSFSFYMNALDVNQNYNNVSLDDNLVNCATGRRAGNGCRAGVQRLWSSRNVGGVNRIPAGYYRGPDGAPWASFCAEGAQCPYLVVVTADIRCAGGASACEYAQSIGFTESIERNANHREFDFERPIGGTGQTVYVVSRYRTTYVPPSPYKEATIYVTNWRGSAGYTNCGLVRMPFDGWMPLFCNKDGDVSRRQFRVRGKWFLCNRVDVRIYSRNSPVDANTEAGSYLGHLRVRGASPSAMSFGFEDQPPNKADWDYDDYIFDIDFEPGLSFYIPGFFSNCGRSTPN